MAGSVNWDETRRRLAVIQQRLEQSWTPSPDKKRKILEARARLLAREPDVLSPASQLHVVEFVLAHEKYGVESSYVREVHPLIDLAPLPCTPPFILGIANVRGQVLSVMDIKKFFDLPEKGLTDLNKLLIVRYGDMELGILADSVLGMRSVALEEVQPPPPTFTGIRAEYLRGLTADRLLILNLEAILLDPRIVVNEQAETSNGG